MTNKEQLLFQSTRKILYDECPKHQEYYYCKRYIGEDEEPRCRNYLFAVVNGKVIE